MGAGDYAIGNATLCFSRKEARKRIAAAPKGTYRVFESIEDPITVEEDSVQLTMLRTTRTVGGKTTVTEEEVEQDVRIQLSV
jgi:hypothetical protein